MRLGVAHLLIVSSLQKDLAKSHVTEPSIPVPQHVVVVLAAGNDEGMPDRSLGRAEHALVVVEDVLADERCVACDVVWHWFWCKERTLTGRGLADNRSAPRRIANRKSKLENAPMADRKVHYEAAFEAFLRDRGIPYVAVDEAKKAMFANSKLKSFDFVVYSQKGVEPAGRHQGPATPRQGR